MKFDFSHEIPNQLLAKINDISITIKREDLIDEYYSGNKFRKLKYNIKNIRDKGFSRLVTFGGAYSNHLYATAIFGKKINIKTTGFVRGNELVSLEKNSTLHFCNSKGMKLVYLNRSSYKLKEFSEEVKMYLIRNPNSYLIPEGGTNSLAIQGCKEILTKKDSEYNTICCAVGTGGTISGIIESSNLNQHIIGFPALRNEALYDVISKMTTRCNWTLEKRYSFGGYGKFTSELIDFINKISINYKILLDPIYTGKMLFGIFDLIKKNKWKWGKNILVIHTGGQQGINGVNQKLLLKKKPQIIIPKIF